MPTIELTQLTKRFGKGPAVVDGLSLTIGAGELLAIVGPTGSGKTTLLRMLPGSTSQPRATFGSRGNPSSRHRRGNGASATRSSIRH